jgi:hypothetical protein
MYNLFRHIYTSIEKFLGYISESEDVVVHVENPITEQPKLLFATEKINWKNNINPENNIEIPHTEGSLASKVL